MPVITETSDAAATTSTSYEMAVGDYFFGTLGTTVDSDWIRVDLTVGQTYSFGLVGVGALSDGVSDTFLRLRDGSGTVIAFDDDSGPGRNSNLTFTASSSGTFYLDVQSWNNAGAGDYGLSMVTGSRPSYDVDMGAGALLLPDASWAATPGTAVTVTWGIRASGTAHDAQNNAVPFEALSAAQVAAATGVMAMFEGISGLTLTQVNPGGTTNSATMLFGAYTSTTDGSGAYAYYPGSTAASANAGDLWLNNNSISQTSVPPGSFSYFALMHETGHALGLSHPGDYNAAPGVSISYANNAQFTEDSHQYTVMSYFDESNTTSSFSSYPDTLLLYDIYALHQLYGADFSYHAGNTTYGFNATVGGAYDFTTNNNPFLSIWDGGGTDTLDLSGYGMAQIVDLRAGQFSSVGGLSGNLSIAIGAVIENAVGGSGNDTITGNSANNQIIGGSGNDLLGGNQGEDTLFGDDGFDNVFGGIGNDTLYGGAQDDTLVGEWGNDVLGGDDGNDLLGGNQGDDWLFGGAGEDTLWGDDGFDNVFGGIGNDTLYGGAQDDTLVGEWGNDVLGGDDGNDLLGGNQGDDWLFGGAGEDTLWGDDGFDNVFGGIGNDTLYGGAQDDTLVGEWGNDVLGGDDGNDLLGGNQGDDWLFGGAGEDTLWGDDGLDNLFGGHGNDRLYGGTGNDTLYGEQGSDTFVFTDGNGTDVIVGFEALNGAERIDLSGVTAISNFTDLRDNHMTQVGGDVLIDTGGGNSIILLSVSLSDLLDDTDFIF